MAHFKIKKIFSFLSFYLVSDELYRKYLFKKNLGKSLNLRDPQTFNEKINARILYDRNPIYTKLADKLLVRDYVKEKIGEKYLVNILGYYKTPIEIPYESLPKKFVLKCNHDAGSTIICTDKRNFNKKLANKKLRSSLRKSMYYRTREWHYKNITPMILCEEYLDIFNSTHQQIQPEDYKIHCFHGKPEFLEIQFSRYGNERFINIYNTQWELLPFLMGYKNAPTKIPAPTQLHELLDLAKKLSAEFDYCRVDFYLANNKIYFGEMTFTPCNGIDKFIPYEWDYKFGEKWKFSLGSKE
ncbi:ATP-grasp fold amidoligase family protein [Proteus vulgaris]|uniref:ATP-grasp fold amidoligase family protein n=1 Tax=Proteus vulgaris TaxID=585 RepID=UPI0034D6EFB6